MSADFTGLMRAAIKGEVVFDRGAGDVKGDTRFQLASVSKAFTAAATLLLVDEGVVGLDTHLDRWFAPLPEAWRDVTVHHLLTHSGGLPHWQDLPDLDLTEPIDHPAEVDMFKRAPLKFQPGAGWYYSSPAYVLLALIVQSESGRPYAGFLRERIFEPLELAATFAGSGQGEANLAPPLAEGRPVKSFELTGPAWAPATCGPPPGTCCGGTGRYSTGGF